MNTLFIHLARTAKLLALIAVLACAAHAKATDYTVSIEYWKFSSPYRFNPNYLEIQAGDWVNFVNADYVFYNYHSVYFPASGDYSGELDVDESIWAQFISPGTYSYYDLYADEYLGIYFSGTIVVKAAQPEPASLGSAFRMTNGNFQCTVGNLTVGMKYTVLLSTNLVDWSPIRTNTATATSEIYTDTSAPTRGAAFYRVVYYGTP
jgi:plastocyanin